MTWDEFWLSFLSNSGATLIAGVLLGSIATIFITRLLRDEEKKIIELEKKISKAKISLEFVNTIKLEIEDLVFYVETITKKIDTKNDLQYLTLQYFHFDISFWEILKTSGEIPSLFDPIILQVFTNFYARVAKCNLVHDQYVLAKINNQRLVTTKELFDELLKSLQSLEGMIEGSKIEIMINEEITKIYDQLIQLESSLKTAKRLKQSQNND